MLRLFAVAVALSLAGCSDPPKPTPPTHAPAPPAAKGKVRPPTMD